MSATAQTDALRRRLLIRVFTAGCLLVVPLGMLAWLAQDASPPTASKTTVQAAAPHAGVLTLATKPVEAEAPGKVEAALLSKANPSAETRGEAPASEVNPQAAATSVSGDIVQFAETGSAVADVTPAGKKAPAPKEKLPRGPHLQAGVFAQAANAQELKAKLEAEGLPVYIESRVQIGPFRNRKEAEAMREKLKADGVATVFIAQ